jgi:hypothetical protein
MKMQTAAAAWFARVLIIRVIRLVPHMCTVQGTAQHTKLQALPLLVACYLKP